MKMLQIQRRSQHHGDKGGVDIHLLHPTLVPKMILWTLCSMRSGHRWLNQCEFSYKDILNILCLPTRWRSPHPMSMNWKMERWYYLLSRWHREWTVCTWREWVLPVVDTYYLIVCYPGPVHILTALTVVISSANYLLSTRWACKGARKHCKWYEFVVVLYEYYILVLSTIQDCIVLLLPDLVSSAIFPKFISHHHHLLLHISIEQVLVIHP